MVLTKTTKCTAYLLDKITDNGVVEVVDGRPLDGLAHVLLLLLAQHQLDEDLLQLLVTEVDAELLEPVVLEHFEPVDVQNAQHFPLGVFSWLKRAQICGKRTFCKMSAHSRVIIIVSLFIFCGSHRLDK